MSNLMIVVKEYEDEQCTNWQEFYLLSEGTFLRRYCTTAEDVKRCPVCGEWYGGIHPRCMCEYYTRPKTFSKNEVLEFLADNLILTHIGFAFGYDFELGNYNKRIPLILFRYKD